LVSKKEDFDENIKTATGGIVSFADDRNEKKTVLDKELKRIIDLFERKKVIVIPKTEVIEKSKPIPEQKESNGYSIIEYVQTKFERPRTYVVYNNCERQSGTSEKEYEGNIHDYNFLKRHEEFGFSIEELEKMITKLEQDVNDGEMIPLERAEVLLCELLKCNFTSSPQKKMHFESVYKVIIIILIIIIYIKCLVLDIKKGRI